MKTTAKKKHPPSAKLLAHLKRLNLSRRKKKPAAKKPAPGKKPSAKKPAARKPKAQAPKPAPAPRAVVPPIPPVELPKGDAPGQTVMPVVEAACGCAPTPVPATGAGEELL